MRGSPTVSTYVLVWAVPASFCALVGIFQAGTAPHPGAAVRWLREHRDLGPRFLGEFVTARGLFQLTLFLVAAIGGLIATGALRTGQVLLGPVAVLLVASPPAAIAEGIRLHKRSPEALPRAMNLLSAALGLAALACGVAIYLLPDSFGENLVGASWNEAHGLILPLSFNFAASGVATGSLVGLRVLGAAQRSFRLRVGLAPVMVTAAVIGLELDDAQGAAIGMAIVGAFAAVIWHHQFMAAMHDSRDRPADGEILAATFDAPV